MSSITLSKISKPETLSNKNDSMPISFLEWRSRNVAISFQEEETQYANYVKNFYDNKDQQVASANAKLKNDYLDLIQKLRLIFENDSEFERYSAIDVSSDTDLAIAIPTYARKLKDIALFYTRKRSEIKNKKVEYNLAGSFNGVSKLLYSNILSKFTKLDNVNFSDDNAFITQSPEFSSVKDNFSIEIEELYDTNDYFEQVENINPFSCIFNDLCFSVFSTPLSAKVDPIENNYICDPSNETVDEFLQKAYEKYLSTNVAYISGGYYVENYKTVTLPFEQGNNFFYWFGGRTVYDIPEGLYKDVDINSIDWTDASGGSALNISDLVFVTVGNSLTQGAWLQDTKTTSVDATMSAVITDGKIFKFPYPYYGLSGVGGVWSGPGIDDTKPISRKFFPTEEDFTNSQNVINRLYWNTFSSISVVESKYLQETNLKKYGYASNKYNNADKVFVSIDNSEKIVYTDDLNSAWLYDFNQTQLPIVPGENLLYFPLQKYTSADELFFTYDAGQSILLSSVSVPDSFAGAVASTDLVNADWIVKNQTVCGPEIEVAWLKSVPLENYTSFDRGSCDCDPDQTTYYTDWYYSSGATQPALSFKCDSNNYVRFVWTGESVSINSLRSFTGFEHDDSCPYKNLDHSKSIIDRNFLNSNNKSLFEKWKRCSCQAIQYSPFGHNESSFEHFKITPDFIVKDTGYPNNFNKKVWVGSDGLQYSQSVDCARFFPNLIEKDVGWGKGVWKNQKSGDFILEKGQSYIYHRADTTDCSYDSPYIVINQKYSSGTVGDSSCVQSSYIPKWFKAVQDSTGEWIDAGVESDMVLEFGSFLKYIHREKIQESRKRFLYSGNEVTSVSGDFVTFRQADSNISFKQFTTDTPSINFLIKIPINPVYNYWGESSYGQDVNTQRENVLDVNNFRIENEYLQITQPPPSRITLNDMDILEYKFGNCDSNCFVWDEDLSFTVVDPVRKWNAIALDECVKSEILTYLNSEMTNCNTVQDKCFSDCNSLGICDCFNFCEPSKTGLTATNISSPVVFNTELSGLPVFINYFARNSFNQDVTVQDITNGEKSVLVPLVSGDFVTAPAPWRNLLNQKGSNFVVEEKIENLINKKDIGFYTPDIVSMGRFETFDSSYTFTPNSSSVTIFRKDNYFDFPVVKSETNSEYVTDLSVSKKNGFIKSKNKQTFYPYTNVEEMQNKPSYGLYEIPTDFSPWNNKTGEWKGGDEYINYRGQYKLTCSDNWYTNQLTLTGDVVNWQTDIFGNQYFLVNRDSNTFTQQPSSYSTIFVKLQNGKVYTASNALSSIIDSYENILPVFIDSFSTI